MRTHNTIALRNEGGITFISVLARRLYLQAVDEFREELQEAVQASQNHVLLNLEKVSVMNSAGLGLLISLHDLLRMQNRKLVITNLQPMMQDIFNRMKLETLIPTVATEEEGRRALQEAQLS